MTTSSVPSSLEANLAVIANAVALSVAVIKNVAGNEASNMIQGASITDAYLSDAVAARLQAKLMPSVGSN